MTPAGRNLEAVQIAADKYDAGGRGSREDADADRDSRMEAYA
jgi:hypothetical protein